MAGAHEWLRAEAEAADRRRLVRGCYWRSPSDSRCAARKRRRAPWRRTRDGDAQLATRPSASSWACGSGERLSECPRAVDEETRVSPTPEARCHGALFGARNRPHLPIGLRGDRGATRRAQRVAPTDARPHVHRILEALSTTDPPDWAIAPIARVRSRDIAELRALADAVEQVVAHRGLIAAATVRRASGSRSRPPTGSALRVFASRSRGGRSR